MSCDVAVVGAGVIGAAVAWRAAQRGLSVVLIDDAPGSGASYAAAGMLAPVSEASYGEEPLLRLGAESLRRYPAFLAELRSTGARAVAHSTAGTLLVALDEDDLRALEERRRFLDELGLCVRTLRGRECRREEPLLTPRLRGGLAVDGDHAVDPRQLLGASLHAAGRVGVRRLPARVVDVSVVGGAVRGVRCADGTAVDAGQVVLAAGAWSGALPGLPAGSAPPVRPVKGQILRLRGPAGPLALGRTVRGDVGGRPVYCVPYGDGRVAVGATVEDRGFDTRVTAGAVRELLDAALVLVPALGELELVEATARPRPATPDNAPLLGPGRLPGLVLATGHYRNGVLLVPATADAVADLLTTGALPDWAAPFNPERFALPPEEAATCLSSTSS